MPSPYRIAIVGAGVAGTTTAYLLARDGHRVTLFEQATELGPVGAGVLLQSSGQAILRHLGILEAVTAHAEPLTELYARFRRGGDLIRTRFPDLHPECRAYGVHRGVLFNNLLKLVRTQPVDIQIGVRIVERMLSTNGVYLKDDCAKRHGPFDLVIAADGSRSRMRAAFRFKASALPYDHGTLWITAPSTAVRHHLLQVVEGNRKLLGLLPLGDGLCSLYWGLPVAEFPHVRSRGLASLKKEIYEFCPETEEILDNVEVFEDLIFTRYQHVSMTRIHDARTIFIGDAAHAMSPHLGQGINLAMVDAWSLAESLRIASKPECAFCLFQLRQRNYLRYLSMVTYFLAPFFQSDWSILGWGRDRVLPWLPIIPWMKKQMLLTVSGQKAGFFGGRKEF